MSGNPTTQEFGIPTRSDLPASPAARLFHDYSSKLPEDNQERGNTRNQRRRDAERQWYPIAPFASEKLCTNKYGQEPSTKSGKGRH